MTKVRSQNYLHGAAILAIGVVIMKILGAIYKIPLANILGDAGFGHFNAAYSVYNVLLTTSTTGLPVALSRMISEANTLGRPLLVRRIFRVALSTFAVLGAVLALASLLFPAQMAGLLINKPESAGSLMALAPAVFLVYLISAFRGYIQGHSDMTPTTVSQVIEVLVKVIIGLSLAQIVISGGGDTPTAAAAAIFGVSAGSLAALAYIVYVYLKIREVPKSDSVSEPLESRGRIFAQLMKIGIPITLGASVLSIISLLDTKLVNMQLLASGLGKTLSDTLYGSYSVMTSLYNLPAAFVTPLIISVVPAISGAIAIKKYDSAGEIAEGSMRIATVISLPMCVGLAVLSKPIVRVLYSNTHEIGPLLLTMLSVAAFFVCLSLMMSSVLQANGNERIPMYSMIIAGAVKLAINWTLVGNPEINIVGAPVGTIACYLIMCIINGYYIKRCMKCKPRYTKILLMPLISSLIMGIAAYAAYFALSNVLGGQEITRSMTAVSLFAAISVGIAIYFLMILFTKAVTYEDLKLLPKGEKIARLLKIK